MRLGVSSGLRAPPGEEDILLKLDQEIFMIESKRMFCCADAETNHEVNSVERSLMGLMKLFKCDEDIND